jgi:site-specific DNA recombinase
MKVIIYKRVSSEDQADRGFSLQHQEDVLRRYCEINQFHIVGIFTEDYSGKTFDRPEWKKVIEYCRANKQNVDLILTTRWDRWSRNQYDALTQMRYLQNFGIAVNTVEQPLDLSNPDNKVLLSLYLTIPEIENDKNSIRTTEGSRKARLLGCWTGTAPRGYKNHRNVDHRSTLMPSDEAPIIKESFVRLASGMYSSFEVRTWLNSKGIKLSKNQFYNLIRNIAYTGKVYVKPYKKEPERIVEGLHQRIVSDEVFAAANKVLRNRRRKMVFHEDKSDLYPLKGHLRCIKHNLSLTAGKSKGRYGLYHYYLCAPKHENCKRYPIADVHEMVEKKLGEIQFAAGVFGSYRSILEKLFKVQDADRIKDIRNLEEELEKSKTRRTVLNERMMDEQITLEEYREMKELVDAKVYKIEKDLIELKGRTAPFREYLNEHIPMLENLQSYYKNSNGKTKNRILSCILSEKIHFEETGVAAIQFSESINLLLHISNELQRSKNKKEVISDLLSNMAPPAGLEPATL